jgi:hypothetical protein
LNKHFDGGKDRGGFTNEEEWFLGIGNVGGFFVGTLCRLFCTNIKKQQSIWGC